MDHSFHRQHEQKIVNTKQPLTVKFFIQDVFFVFCIVWLNIEYLCKDTLPQVMTAQ